MRIRLRTFSKPERKKKFVQKTWLQAGFELATYVSIKPMLCHSTIESCFAKRLFKTKCYSYIMAKAYNFFCFVDFLRFCAKNVRNNLENNNC
jgi:hypothetical protein